MHATGLGMLRLPRRVFAKSLADFRTWLRIIHIPDISKVQDERLARRVDDGCDQSGRSVVSSKIVKRVPIQEAVET